MLREILRAGAQLQLNAVLDPGEADREFFELFRRAGGLMVMMFAESMSDRMLEVLAKPFRVDAIRRDASELHRAKIAFGMMPTLGGPGETQETALETLRGTRTLEPMFYEFGIGWRIRPRTALRARAVADGLLSADDDCFDPRFCISSETPKAWLEEQVKLHAQPKLGPLLRVFPLMSTFVGRPWKRGPEDPGASLGPEGPGRTSRN